jgi:SAM-dependent methyltransferase
MTLSDLVHAKKYLDKINATQVNASLSNLQKDLDIAGVSLNVDFLNLIQEVNTNIVALTDQLVQIDSDIQAIKNKLNLDITNLSAPYKIEGNTVGSVRNVCDTTVDIVREFRQKIFTDDVNYELISSIRNNTSPIYPSLDLMCGDGYWTKYMVGADPLYIVDMHPEFIESTLSQFPEAYQRRLRPYLMKYDNFEKDDLSLLPQNQFGFVLAINVFDFFTLDRIHNYLQQIFNLMRPGGKLLFTYNNCEESNNARFVETGFKGWATKTDLEDFCKTINFEILKSISRSNINWLEIKKPGELKTVKTHQAMGEIINRCG